MPKTKTETRRPSMPWPVSIVDECEECHHLKPGRWLDTGDGSGEWFACYDCQRFDPEKE